MRCSLYNGAGDLVGGTDAGFRHGFTSTRDGGSTLDAGEFCELIFRAVDETLTCSGEGVESIDAVALSTFWHSVLGVDRRGQPTTPILTGRPPGRERCRRAPGAAVRGHHPPEDGV